MPARLFRGNGRKQMQVIGGTVVEPTANSAHFAELRDGQATPLVRYRVLQIARIESKGMRWPQSGR
ncbi:MAG: hypothetical protein IPO05_08175 [Flavobacteriales bacterium]|jgi:hypothetical protein|nr:hypothetical protein [Flavobacteriales bacterium]MBK9513591.1 hypothetical protein [Flavobacteriales bacterium]MBP7450653.1 hypothetical protein [Flavobacteriales bacterium]HOZ39701.1 hypothetical protein [Flavobacteriales bacterium]